MKLLTMAMLICCLLAGQLPAQPPSEPSPPQGRRGVGFGGSIELGPDDKQTFPDPPSGVARPRADVPRGKLEMIDYESKTVGTTRKMNVYTPPGYSAEQAYPVLYLLHGIGGDETEWQRFAQVDRLLDNLIAEKRAVPMIVVMPNGRAQKNDRAPANAFEAAPSFAVFEQDLLTDVIPAIESRYAVIADRHSRALAGLSMGGGQSLNFGLTHLDTFAWVGGFSSAPNTKAPQELVPDPAKTTEQLRLLWLSCGNKDNLISVSQRVQRYLKEHEVPHRWNVDSHGHDPTHWQNNLYHFVQLLFQDTKPGQPSESQAAQDAESGSAPQGGKVTEGDQTDGQRVGPDTVIKDAYREAFLIGMAGDLPSRYSEEELRLAAKHFNAITPENCMKPQPIQPQEGQWQFERPDALVQWAQEHGMTIHGHTLVWHQQSPDWFFEGGDQAVIAQRMKRHIETVVGRYRGKLQSWDVVNEAIQDGGNAATAMTENLRDSKWLQSLGPEYLTLAFRFAHAVDPEATLYYNDYNIESGPKHQSSLVLLKRLLDEGAPVHAVGIQGHWRSGRVPLEDIDRAIANYSALGLKVSITELDVTIGGASGGQLGPGGGRNRQRPASVASAEDLRRQAEDYAKLFAIFKKHEQAIERVTFWGLNDRRTWRTGQHPLLFDAMNAPKPAYDAILGQATTRHSSTNKLPN